jgi:hypothetical protein
LKKTQEFKTTGIWKNRRCRMRLKTDGLAEKSLFVIAVRLVLLFQGNCTSVLWPRI